MFNLRKFIKYNKILRLNVMLYSYLRCYRGIFKNMGNVHIVKWKKMERGKFLPCMLLQIFSTYIENNYQCLSLLILLLFLKLRYF